MHLKTETSGIMVWACRMSPGLDCPVARGDRALRAGIAGSNWRAPAWEAEFTIYLKEKKSYWLAPIIFVLMALSALAFFLEGSVLAPAIYSVF